MYRKKENTITYWKFDAFYKGLNKQKKKKIESCVREGFSTL